ncbi:MAG: hypothetical protein KBD21_01660 [Candidatus Pacebacteria bacterium]|nr:hypothetical protein [Candidatus Paceibacterota bacterium]
MEAAFAEALQGMNIYTLLAITLWSLPWKMWALWLAARRGDVWWFIGMSIFNTMGIIDIIYIFVIAKQKDTRGDVTTV